MKREDFYNAIDNAESLIDTPTGMETEMDTSQAADACYELAKQMAIEFAVYNGMLPEVADYHFKEFETQSNEK